MLADRILLNGRPARPGDRYETGDRVIVDGKDVSAHLKAPNAPRVIIYHKAQGQPVTASIGGVAGDLAEKSVMESVPSIRGARWLMINTMQTGDSGLMLLTSDGRLADALRRRAESIPAAYVARVLVPTPEFDIASFPKVVSYDEGTVEFESIEPAGGEGTNRWFRVESRRAHRRAAVRALFESRGLKVSRVIQVSFADLELPRELPRGKHRALTKTQLDALYALAELEPVMPVERKPEARRERRPAPDRRRRSKRRATGSPRSRR
jgi:23S rRNA pseudouridine2605 synthase